MKFHQRRPRARTLLAALLLVIGALSAGFMGATSANADVSVHTLQTDVIEAWGPYTSSDIGEILGSDSNITISCYVIGQSVSGEFGSETVWDEVTGGVDSSDGAYVETGVFVPDADVYTGSNSPVVPSCSTALGRIIGGNWVNMYSGPSEYYDGIGSIDSGTYVEIKCYGTGMQVTGPYGPETDWDLITATLYGPYEWVPDALVYTGSNSAVVPACPAGDIGS